MPNQPTKDLPEKTPNHLPGDFQRRPGSNQDFATALVLGDVATMFHGDRSRSFIRFQFPP